ncbi:MAG: universal stress protein [Streptosporangiales bacterium]
MIPAPDATGTDTGIRASCPYRQVLVGWDGSADSVAALHAAAGIVGDCAGRVVAVAVLPPSASMEQPGSGAAGSEAAAARQSFEHARRALLLGPGTRMSLHVARGQHAAQSICQYAADHGFDLIVLGRHGEGGLVPHRLGHVAETTARDSRIPVLLLSSS